MKKMISPAATIVCATAFVAFAAFPAVAATVSSPPVDSVPEKVAPDAKPTEPPKNLSQELDQSNGVIHPKEVDPAIEKPAPKTHTNDVVKPPGTLGGADAPQPK